MKNLSSLLFGLITIVALFFTACEKETISTEATYSAEVERIYSTHLSLEAEHNLGFALSKEDIKNALALPTAKNDCTYDCCFNILDLLTLNNCFNVNPPSAICLENADFNCDGEINVLDYVTLLGNPACSEVEPLIIGTNGYLVSGGIVASENQWTAYFKNYSTINGDLWFLTSTSNTIDATNWYYDGALVSTANSIQFEYPGAINFDIPIDCNYGWHELTLEIEVDCQVYSTTSCINVKMVGVTTSCESDYCNP